MSFFARFIRRKSEVEFHPARAARGQRVYAVGDIHGRLDLLDVVRMWIEADIKDCSAPSEIIFLGDYVDRGPDSAGVLERLSGGEFPCAIRTLKGNHEEMLLAFLEDPSVLENWRRYGGLETLHSYGVNVSDVMRGAKFDVAQKALLEALPESHLALLESCEFSAESGDYFFCHAGVRPGVPLNQQNPADLLWIREEFLKFGGDFGKMIVHGHTPAASVEILPNRINVDTGGYATGALSCVVLEDETVRFFTT